MVCVNVETFQCIHEVTLTLLDLMICVNVIRDISVFTHMK